MVVVPVILVKEQKKNASFPRAGVSSTIAKRMHTSKPFFLAVDSRCILKEKEEKNQQSIEDIGNVIEAHLDYLRQLCRSVMMTQGIDVSINKLAVR